MGTRVYVDTWLLRGLVSKKKHERMDAKREISRLESNSFDVVIPQIVIGETVSVLMRDFPDPSEAKNRLVKLYDSIKKILDPSSCLPPISMLILEKARELKSGDGNLKDTDAIIVSHTLLDPNSQRLLTADTDLLNSEFIKQMENEMRASRIRRKRLKIVDGL